MSNQEENNYEGQTFYLRGYERMASMGQDSSLKICHSMLVHHQVESLVQHLPQAVLQTFNSYPRMRATMVRDAFATAIVNARISKQEIEERSLLRIKNIDSEDEDNQVWQKYVVEQCENPFDRYKDFAYYLEVWVDQVQDRARLLLFSDHYMSDGMSGMNVLNQVLESASKICLDSTAETPDFELTPSLYDIWVRSTTLSHWVRKSLVWMLAKPIFKHEVAQFNSALPLRDDQQDFTMPPPKNTSSGLFATGTEENKVKTLAKCKDENVTFGGALVATVMLSYFYASNQDRESDEKFKLGVDMDYNMRQRAPEKVDPKSIGFYAAMNSLENLGHEGVSIKGARFWDCARDCKKEINDVLASFTMPFQFYFCDQQLHTEQTAAYFEDLKIAKCATCDIDVSNIGRYPHATTHEFKSQDGNQDSENLTIKSCHVYTSVPHMGCGTSCFISCVEAFNYGMVHKYQPDDANRLFNAIVTIIENMGTIGQDETMLQVMDRLLPEFVTIKKEPQEESSAAASA